MKYGGERDNFIDMYEIVHRLCARDCEIYFWLRKGYLSIKCAMDSSNDLA